MSAIGTLTKLTATGLVVVGAFAAGRFFGAYDVLDDIASGDVTPEEKFKEYDIKDCRDKKTADQVFEQYFAGMSADVEENLITKFFTGDAAGADFVSQLGFGFSKYELADGGKGYFQKFDDRTAVHVMRDKDGQYEFLVLGAEAETFTHLFTGSTIEKLDVSISSAFNKVATD